MTTKTRAELKNQALTNLLVIGSGQEAEAEDTAVVEALVDALVEDLNARGIVYVPNTDEIELSVFLPLAELLANEAAPSFGQPKNEAKREACEDRLRTVVKRVAGPRKTLQTDLALRSAGIYTYNLWRRGV